jgi:hypothetical protein
MSIHLIPATSENLEKIKGQKFVPHDGEGVVYVKLVMIKPDTMALGNPESLVEDADGVILCGDLQKIKAQIGEWLDQTIEEYDS